MNAPIHHKADLGGKSLKVRKFIQRGHWDDGPDIAFSAKSGR